MMPMNALLLPVCSSRLTGQNDAEIGQDKLLPLPCRGPCFYSAICTCGSDSQLSELALIIKIATFGSLFSIGNQSSSSITCIQVACCVATQSSISTQERKLALQQALASLHLPSQTKVAAKYGAYSGRLDASAATATRLSFSSAGPPS